MESLLPRSSNLKRTAVERQCLINIPHLQCDMVEAHDARWVRPAQDAIATTAIDTVGAATERLSVHRFVGPKRIKGTAGVYEAGVAAVA